MANILTFNDDVHIVFADVDVGVVVIEGGEGDFIDALLDGRNPYHGRRAVARTVRTGVEQIHGTAVHGFNVA